jgi:hypothetical protein
MRVLPLIEYGSKPKMSALQHDAGGMKNRVSKTDSATGGARLDIDAVVGRVNRKIPGAVFGNVLARIVMGENGASFPSLIWSSSPLRKYGTGDTSCCGIRPESEALVGRWSLETVVPVTRSIASLRSGLG